MLKYVTRRGGKDKRARVRRWRERGTKYGEAQRVEKIGEALILQRSRSLRRDCGPFQKRIREEKRKPNSEKKQRPDNPDGLSQSRNSEPL